MQSPRAMEPNRKASVYWLIVGTTEERTIITVYKPHAGKLENMINFLKFIFNLDKVKRREVLILCDFNTDWLKRDATDTVNLNNFVKGHGLTQCMNEITRPNRTHGTAIYLIMTDCNFINTAGTLDDMIADHYTAFPNSKKGRNTKYKFFTAVRDYRKYISQVLLALFKTLNWNLLIILSILTNSGTLDIQF